MKIKNLKLRKQLLAILTTSSIALTGITTTVHASGNLLDEILTAADGYETPHHYDGVHINKDKVEEVKEPVVVEQPVVVEDNTPVEEVVVVEEQIPVEEPVDEDPTIDTEAETPSSNLLNLMSSEANKAVLDFFDDADRELNDYMDAGAVEELIPIAQSRVAQGIDFLFFNGTILNHTKEELSEDSLRLFVEQLNNYINMVKGISKEIVTNMDEKYDEASYYINTDNIGQFDEIGTNIINEELDTQMPIEEPVDEDPTIDTEAETISGAEEVQEEVAAEEAELEAVEEAEPVEISEEAEQSVNSFFASIEEVLVDYINNGDMEGLVINAQDTVKLAMDFLFFNGSVNGFTKEQVSRQTISDTIFRLNNYIQVVEEISPGFLTNMDPRYDECTIYLSDEFIDDFNSIGEKIAADPVDEADETYTLR